MSTRNILIAIAIVIIIIGVALALRGGNNAPVTATPTPSGSPLPTGTLDFDGAIQSIGSGNITIKGDDGVVTEIVTSSSTTYYDESSQVISRTSFAAGQWVSARVTRNSSGKLEATSVMKWYAPGTGSAGSGK